MSEANDGPKQESVSFAECIAMLPLEVRNRHRADLDYIGQKMVNEWSKKPLKSMLDLSAKDLRAFFGCIEANVEALKHITFDFLDDRQNIIFYILASIKLHMSGATLAKDVQSLEELEAKTEKKFTLDDLPLFMKVGQEGGPEYAPVVSKIRHRLSHGTAIGRESVDWHKSDNAHKKFLEAKVAAKTGTDNQKCLLGIKDFPEVTSSTAAQRVVAPVYAFINTFADGKASFEEFKAKFNETLTDLVEIIGNNLLHVYFHEDGEVLYEDNFNEAVFAAAGVTGLTTIYDQFCDPVGAASRFNQAVQDQASDDLQAMITEYVVGRMGEDFRSKFLNPVKRSVPAGRIQPKTILVQILGRTFIKSFAIRKAKNFDGLSQSIECVKDDKMQKIPILDFGKNNEELAASSILRNTIWAGLNQEFIYNRKEGQPLTPDEKKHYARMMPHFASALQCADNPLEIAYYLNIIPPYVTYFEDLNELQMLAFRKLEKDPSGSIKPLLAYLEVIDPVIAQAGGTYIITQRPTLRTLDHFLNRQAIKRNPELIDRLVDVLVNPDYRTFYSACAVAAMLLQREQADEEFAHTILKKIFTQPGHLTDPVRFAALRNIYERLNAQQRSKVLSIYTSMGIRSNFEGIDSALMVRMTNMLSTMPEIEPAAGPPEKAVPKPRLQFWQGSSNEAMHKAAAEVGLMPDRDLQSLIDSILASGRRSSHITSDKKGHKLACHASESPLAAALGITEVQVKRNRETVRPPENLACNITFNFSALGVIHCALKEDGSMVVRIFNDKGAEVSRVERDGVQENDPYLSPRMFDELHYLCLKKLEAVIARRAVQPTDVTVELPAEPDPNQTPTPVPPPPSSDPSSEPRVEILDGVPFTAERLEQPVVFELNPAAEADRIERERVDKIWIDTNRGRAVKVFAPLLRGESLPETPPPEIDDLVLHRFVRSPERVELAYRANQEGQVRSVLEVVEKAQNLYEALPDSRAAYEAIRTGGLLLADVFVRRTRAFGSPLNYHIQTHLEDDVGTLPQPLYDIRRNHMREAETATRWRAFRTESRDEIDFGPNWTITLEHEVPDTPLNRALFNRVRAKTDTQPQPVNVESVIFNAMMEIRVWVQEQFTAAQDMYLQPSENPAYVREGKIAFEKRMADVNTEAKRRWHKDIEQTVAAARQQYQEAVDNAEDLAKRAKTTTVVREGVVVGTNLRIPQPGNPYDRTLNQGTFQPIMDLLAKARLSPDIGKLDEMEPGDDEPDTALHEEAEGVILH